MPEHRPQFSELRLTELDRTAPSVLVALEYLRLAPLGSINRPGAFRCSDGLIYWLKTRDRVPGALTRELIAGRLGQLTGFAPAATVVMVPGTVLPSDPDAYRFFGAAVGIRDVPRAINVRELELAIAARTAPDRIDIDLRTWLETVAFQTWLGVRDQQVLIVLATGQVRSLDHEEYSAVAPDSQLTPCPVIDPILGVPPPKHLGLIRDAVARIEGISDADLLACVAAEPGCLPTLLGRSERLCIAERLAARRDRLRPVLESWART